MSTTRPPTLAEARAARRAVSESLAQWQPQAEPEAVGPRPLTKPLALGAAHNLNFWPYTAGSAQLESPHCLPGPHCGNPFNF